MTSGPLLDRSAAPEPGRPAALSPLVRRATAPNPGMMTGPGTNTYVVGTTDVAVVDPGPEDEGHVAAIDALAALGGGRIRWIVVTHTPLDHSPAAAALAARTGAHVIGFDARDDFAPDQSVGDGFVLAGPDFSLRAVHTPGHASNHVCWLLEGEGMLFSGDHVMQGSTVVISPPDGDMAVYLDSLAKVRALGPALRSIAPGHGSVIEEPAAILDGIVAHRLRREETVAAALVSIRRGTVDELIPLVYADVEEKLHPVARRSLWAHLRKLADDGRARSEDPDDIDVAWEPLGV